MRENILDKERSPDLQVYAIWLNQRVTDAREEIDESILADARVTQYWDGQGITGRHFADTDLGGLGYAGFIYDVYYVFGPAATWGKGPAPLAGSGSPVLYEGEKLLAALDAQLGA